MLGIAGVSICAVFVSLLLKKYLSSRPGKHIVAKLAWALFAVFITCIGAVKIAYISCYSFHEWHEVERYFGWDFGWDGILCDLTAITAPVVVFSIIFGVLSGTLFYRSGERKWGTFPVIFAAILILVSNWIAYLHYLAQDSFVEKCYFTLAYQSASCNSTPAFFLPGTRIEFGSRGGSFDIFFANLTQMTGVFLIPLGIYILCYALTVGLCLWRDRRHVIAQVVDAKLPTLGGAQ